MSLARPFIFSFLFCFSLLTLAGNKPVIKEDFQNTPLKEVLGILKKKYKVKIAYSVRLIEGKQVTATLDGLNLEEAIAQILEGQSLDYQYIEPNAVILKKSKKAESSTQINGEIFDSQTGERLPFAVVTDLESGSATTTNEEGYFSLTTGEFNPRLSISYIGYFDTLVAVSNVENKRLMIGVRSSYNTLGEVLVTGTSDNFSSPDGNGEIDLNPNLVRRTPQTAEKDVFRMLQLLPGVVSTNELSSGLSINGGTSEQNLILFDGFSIYHQDHLFGYFSAINPYAIKSVRTLKTGYSARYGGRSSGIVQFTGNDGNNSRVAGKFGLNLLSANLGLEVPITNNTTTFFSARRSYTDFYSSFLFERIFDLYYEEFSNVDAVIESQDYSPEFYYDDVNFKITSRLGARDLFSFSFYNSNDRLDFNEHLVVQYPEDTVARESNLGAIEWGNTGASMQMMRLWNDTDFSHFTLSFSDYGSNYREQSEEEITIAREPFTTINSSSIQSNGIEDLGMKLSHEAHISNVIWQFGAEFSFYNTFIENTLNEEPLIEKKQAGATLSTLYTQADIRIRPTTRLGIGTRGTYASTRGQTYFEPRLSLTEELNPNLSLRASVGRYNQFVNQVISRNVLQGSRDLWVLSDDEVPVQLADHYTVGGSWQKNGFGLDMSLFHRNFSGLLYYAFIEGNEITQFTNYEESFFEGDGRATGWELLLKKESPTFSGWVSYTLSRSDAKYDDLNGGEWFSADQDQRHEINFYVSKKLGPFNLYSTWIYGSGRPYSTFGGGNDTREDRRGDIILINTSQINNLRLDDYHRLDLGVSSVWKWGRTEVEGNIHLFNVYDRKNIGSVQLNPIPGPSPDENPAMDGNGDGAPDDGPPPPPDGGPPGDGGPPDGPPPPGGGPPMPSGGPPRGNQGDRQMRQGFTSSENVLMRFTPSLSIEIRF